VRLYLVRHGPAEARRSGHTDRDRALTAEGGRRVARQAAMLMHCRIRAVRVVTSPYRRARQTADLLSAALDLPVEEDRLLVPGASLDDLAELAGRYDEDHVLCVSHQPSLSTWVFRLTGCRVRMAPGAVAILDVHRVRPGSGELRALLPPDVQERLGARWSA
jgi:phosphohistidine phosphatase